jgi:hypothetical protein
VDRKVGGIFMLVSVLIGALVAGHIAPKQIPGRAIPGGEVVAVLTGLPPQRTAPESSCLALAQGMTGMPDVTAGGRLRTAILLQRFDKDGNTQSADGPRPPGSGDLGSCSLQTVGTGKLTGSLIGLGSNPLPLTG